jgi:hypothetical protein
MCGELKQAASPGARAGPKQLESDCTHCGCGRLPSPQAPPPERWHPRAGAAPPKLAGKSAGRDCQHRAVQSRPQTRWGDGPLAGGGKASPRRASCSHRPRAANAEGTGTGTSTGHSPPLLWHMLPAGHALAMAAPGRGGSRAGQLSVCSHALQQVVLQRSSARK